MSALAIFSDPRQRTVAVVVLLGLLTFIALLLRSVIDIDGALDTDTINYGLAAFRFDLLQHQPHPPGYPGYVLLLKAIHLVAPGLGPLEVAKWGSRLCGAATVPAAYLACGLLLRAGEKRPVGRPLAAASLAALHPVLWYYGADGQSHAAEGLFTLLLLAGAVAVKRWPTRARLLLLVAAFGLAGSIRPTIPLLCSPLLVWLLWRRPWLDWLQASLVGLSAVAAWLVPLVWLVGGWELLLRINHALVGELFVANYSLLGERAFFRPVAANINMALYAMLLASVPFLAWSRGDRGDSPAAKGGLPRWRGLLLLLCLANFLFYALLYVSEAGYFTAVAALACLVPATWPESAGLGQRARAALALVAGPVIVFGAPASLPVVYHSSFFLPTMDHVVRVESLQLAQRKLICGASGGAQTLLLSDNPVTTHTRQIPLHCPEIALGLHMYRLSLNPKLDNLLIYDDGGLLSVPGRIPLEPGPAAEVRLPRKVRRVMLAPDASPDLRARVEAQSRCSAASVTRSELKGLAVEVWPVGCLPRLRLGRNTLVLGGP
jgi:hypothetical protein